MGQWLLLLACVNVNKGALRTAMAKERAHVLEMGSTMPSLTGKLQDLRLVTMDRNVNRALYSQVRAAVGSKTSMVRCTAAVVERCTGDRR